MIDRKFGLGLIDPKTGDFETINNIVHEYIKNNLRFTCERILEHRDTGEISHSFCSRVPVPIKTKLFVHLDDEIITEVIIKEEWV